LSEPDKGDSRNESCVLNLMFTFLLKLHFEVRSGYWGGELRSPMSEGGELRSPMSEGGELRSPMSEGGELRSPMSEGGELRSPMSVRHR
jgi:hypothetical protein